MEIGRKSGEMEIGLRHHGRQLNHVAITPTLYAQISKHAFYGTRSTVLTPDSFQIWLYSDSPRVLDVWLVFGDACPSISTVMIYLSA
jgi:hypothetical protein